MHGTAQDVHAIKQQAEAQLLADGLLKSLLLEYQKESRTTLVLVTHSLDIAKMADRMIFLQDGRITSG